MSSAVSARKAQGKLETNPQRVNEWSRDTEQRQCPPGGCKHLNRNGHYDPRGENEGQMEAEALLVSLVL